ncbi:hypothetical protein [Loktanella salsilacus]|uniref:hypothetical protein n=1 Tax=Loktanella salsilacus TaxID=195913 RepID=UPI0037363318
MLFQQDLVARDYPLPDFEALTRQHRIKAFREDAIYAGIASIPRRAANLRLVIDCLYNQIETFFVYLNDYESVPDWLDDPKVVVFRSQDYQDLNATGKVFFAGVVDKGYFLTLDDDFIYPGDYAARMAGTIARYDNRVAACVHGSIFPPDPAYYYMRSAIYQYQGPLARDRFVCLPGTGSFGVKAGTMDLSLDQFLPQVMVDLACAILCRRSGVPLVSIARPNLWMQNTDREGLYHLFTQEKTHHSHYAKAVGPWDFSEYAPALNQIAQAVAAKGGSVLDDPLADQDAFLAARTGTLPQNWTDTSQHYVRVSEFLRAQMSGFRV